MAFYVNEDYINTLAAHAAIKRIQFDSDAHSRAHLDDPRLDPAGSKDTLHGAVAQWHACTCTREASSFNCTLRKSSRRLSGSGS